MGIIEGNQKTIVFSLSVLGAGVLAYATNETAHALGDKLALSSRVDAFGTGLIAGLTTAAAVPLSKKSLEIYTSTYLNGQFDHKADLHRILIVGGTTLLTTTLLVHRFTPFFNGYDHDFKQKRLPH